MTSIKKKKKNYVWQKMYFDFLQKSLKWETSRMKKKWPLPRASHLWPTFPISLGLRNTGLFQEPGSLLLLSTSQQEDSSCDPFSPQGTRQGSGPRLSRARSGLGRLDPLHPAQWWACSDLAPSAKSPNPPGQWEHSTIHELEAQLVCPWHNSIFFHKKTT